MAAENNTYRRTRPISRTPDTTRRMIRRANKAAEMGQVRKLLATLPIALALWSGTAVADCSSWEDPAMKRWCQERSSNAYQSQIKEEAERQAREAARKAAKPPPQELKINSSYPKEWSDIMLFLYYVDTCEVPNGRSGVNWAAAVSGVTTNSGKPSFISPEASTALWNGINDQHYKYQANRPPRAWCEDVKSPTPDVIPPQFRAAFNLASELWMKRQLDRWREARDLGPYRGR